MNILALSLSYNVVWFCELPSDYQIIYSCSVIYLWLCYSYIRALNVLYNGINLFTTPCVILNWPDTTVSTTYACLNGKFRDSHYDFR